MRILVADDQGFWRRALEEVLGGRGHQVLCVEDGEAAWRALESDPDIELLVTDWVMPGLSGPELCRRVRAAARRRYLPVIVMTSRSDTSALLDALDSGADAFVAKPFDPAELAAQVGVAERIVAMEARLADRLTELRRAGERIERDLAHAAEVQQAFLPSGPPDVPGLHFAWHHECCAHLGGDLFNVFRVSQDHVGFYVLDVSGHGTPAALHSVSVSHALHPQQQQGGVLKRVGPQGWEAVPPAAVANELNRRFPLMERSGHYLSFVYALLEIASGRVRFVRAGHPPAIHLTASGARVCDAGGGVPIGVTERADYRDEELQLEPGDALLLYSDGLIEARDEHGREFGIERVLDVAQRGRSEGIAALVARLERALTEWLKGEPMRDDVTVVGMARDTTDR